MNHCFGDLQNYTTLKRVLNFEIEGDGFGDLQNYTTLKLTPKHFRIP